MPSVKRPVLSKVVLAGTTELVSGIESKIYSIRGQRVMLSHDLAQLYGLDTKILMQSFRRNLERFPSDFQFSLTDQELIGLRSQIVTSNRGGVRYAPVAFTEQGVAMLSGILRSSEAISVNIEIMRTFVKLRGMMAEHSELKQQLNALEKKYDHNFKAVFDAINQLMTPPEPAKKKRIGFIQE